MAEDGPFDSACACTLLRPSSFVVVFVPRQRALVYMRTGCALQDIPLISMFLDQIQPRLDGGRLIRGTRHGMNGPDETAWPTTAWETFVLASCARLAQFPQVHLAPKFPPGRLNLALRTQLPLMENELLVALIDNDAGGFQNEIILTTSRLYWSERDLADAGSRNGLKSSVAIRAYGVDYALIPQGACVVPSGEGSVQIALGSGQSLPLQGGDSELAEALAGYLRTVGDAARKGVDP